MERFDSRRNSWTNTEKGWLDGQYLKRKNASKKKNHGSDDRVEKFSGFVVCIKSYEKVVRL